MRAEYNCQRSLIIAPAINAGSSQAYNPQHRAFSYFIKNPITVQVFYGPLELCSYTHCAQSPRVDSQPSQLVAEYELLRSSSTLPRISPHMIAICPAGSQLEHAYDLTELRDMHPALLVQHYILLPSLLVSLL